jgi:hypothetical protein
VAEFHLAARVDLARDAGLIGNNDQEIARLLHTVESLWNTGNYLKLPGQVSIFGVVYIENAVTVEKHTFSHCCKYRSQETGVRIQNTEVRSQELVSIKKYMFGQDSDSCLLSPEF